MRGSAWVDRFSLASRGNEMENLNLTNPETHPKEQYVGNLPLHLPENNDFDKCVIKKENEHYNCTTDEELATTITDEALPNSSSTSNSKRYRSDDMGEFQCKRERTESPKDFIPFETSHQPPSISEDFKTRDTFFTENTKPLLMEDKSKFLSFRYMNLKAKIGICAANYPKGKLSQKQVMALQLFLEKEILTPEGHQVKPRFFGLKMKDGCLTLICGDASTIAWVKSLVGKMEKTIKMRLRVVDYMPTEKSFIVVGHFSKSQEDSNADVLNYLKAQNSGLNVSKWKVLERISENKKRGIRLILSVDWESADLIKRKGPKLNYKLGIAKFLIVSKRGLQFKEEDDEEDEDEFEDEFEDDLDGYPMQFLNPHNSFDVKPAVQNEFLLSEPCSISQVPPPYNLTDDEDYSAKIAMMAEQSKTRFKYGKTSRERYKRWKNWGKKKKNSKKFISEADVRI